MKSHFLLVENFHLRLLRGLAERFRGRAWALKGGVCLRLFHRSPRLSEDMDLDLDPRVGVASAQKAVDSVLESAALARSLSPLGVAGLKLSRPKQTATTLRWKALLSMEGGGEAHTKVEISRRRRPVNAEQGIPDAAMLLEHALPPFAVPYYPANAMVRQKTEALASPGRNAARDVYDLHHLFHHAGADPKKALTGLTPEIIAAALAKIRSFSRADLAAQVLPFLPMELADLYHGRDAFGALQREVSEAIMAGQG